MSKRAMTMSARALPAPWPAATAAAVCLAAWATGAAAEAASPVTHYGLDQAKSTLEFTFMQAGAPMTGHQALQIRCCLQQMRPDGGRRHAQAHGPDPPNLTPQPPTRGDIP